MAETARRLGPQDWLSAGLKALARDGAAALKAEPLARRLGTTKGSFYWHFADVPAFHEALLAEWEDRESGIMRKFLGEDGTAVGRLRRLAQVIASDQGDDAIEPSVRAWARGDARARAAVDRVDSRRLGEFQALLGEIGIGNPEMARIIYAAGIGMKGLPDRAADENARAMGSLVDLVLALR